MKISIIIPTLNEALTIKKILLALQYLREKGHEIILVDGGSRDGTSDIAKDMVDNVIHTVSGRAQQMNIGADNASGDLFIFLHADTLLPQSFEINLINNINSDRQWGRFNIKLSGGDTTNSSKVSFSLGFKLLSITFFDKRSIFSLLFYVFLCKE